MYCEAQGPLMIFLFFEHVINVYFILQISKFSDEAGIVSIGRECQFFFEPCPLCAAS